MRKPDLVRAIYVELRRNVAKDIPDGDILRLAHLIVRSQLEERDLLADFGRAGIGHSLLNAEVDEAMSDGGWRILEYEVGCRGVAENLDPTQSYAARTLIERYLGPEWQHHQWIGPLSPQ